MPNHCENHTSIIGPKDDIERLFAVLDTTNTDHPMANLCPMPIDIEEGNIREWTINNWGTKWGDYDYFTDDIQIGRAHV